MKKSLLALTLFGVVPGFLVAGCSGGGGHGGFIPPGAGGSLGPVTSDLPATDLNAAGYDFESVAPGTSMTGAVAALGVAPAGTASLVAYTPLNAADLLDNGALSPEQTFSAAPSSIARLGSDTDMFLATTDRLVNGAGDVYRRSVNGGGNNVTWAIALDSDRSEAFVAAVGTSVLALIGGPEQAGEVQQWDPNAQAFASIASLGSVTPTAAAELDGTIYVGCTAAITSGGAASLYRLNAGAVEEIALPLQAPQAPNVRQEITAMLTVANATQGETLFLAIGLYDLISGAALNGHIYATNGVDFEQVLTFNQDAPSSFAWHDTTVYAGSQAGRLIHREDNGTWFDETSLPTSTGVTALLSLTADTLLIGARADTGPLVFIRTEKAGSPSPNPSTSPSPMPSTPPAGSLSYATNVAQVMETCASCHKAAGRVGGNMVLTNPVDTNADYMTLQGYINLGTPTDSAILTVPQGGGGHAVVLGGAGDPSYDTLLSWVQGGALP